MRLRLGIAIGFGVGYVLGTRAGRERYEQLRTLASKAAEHPTVAELLKHCDGMVNKARQVTATGLEAGSEGLASVSQNSAQR